MQDLLDKYYLVTAVRLSDNAYMAHQKTKDPDEARRVWNLLKEEFIDPHDEDEVYLLNFSIIDPVFQQKPATE